MITVRDASGSTITELDHRSIELADHTHSSRRGGFTTLASELLGAAAEREMPQLDEQLYFQVFAKPVPVGKRSAPTR